MESFEAEDWEVCPKNRDFGDAERGHDWLEVLVCAACGKEDYSKNAESFSAEKCQVCNCALTGKNSGGMNTYCDGCYGNLGMSEAESFDAEEDTSLSLRYNHVMHKLNQLANEVHDMLESKASAYLYSAWDDVRKSFNQMSKDGYNMQMYNAESFDAEGVPEGFHRMPDGTIMADSAHGAESFDAEVYGIESGSKIETSFQNLFEYLNSAIDDEYFLTKKERDDYFNKNYAIFSSESFSADGIYQMCKMCGDKADALIDSPIYGMVCRECFEPDAGYYGAEESFDAQTKITGYTRGKDWEGKPYTGQIFPDHSDLDHELADRNQDGKMASWERAIGNQVARGKSRFKAPRKMLNPRLSQMKSSTTHSSILPYALAVGALATIMGLRNMGGSNE